MTGLGVLTFVLLLVVHLAILDAVSRVAVALERVVGYWERAYGEEAAVTGSVEHGYVSPPEDRS